MNFFKRSLLSIKRKLGKSLILFLIVFILVNVIAGAVSIYMATQAIERTTKEKLGAIATIKQDQRKVNKVFENSNWDDDEMKRIFGEMVLTESFIKQVGDMDAVDYYTFTISAWGESKVYKDIEYNQEEKKFMKRQPHRMGSDDDSERLSYFSITGLNAPVLIDEKQGKIKVVKGEIPSQSVFDSGDNFIIVSKPFAEEHGLDIGSEVKYINQIWDWSSDSHDNKPKEEVESVFRIAAIFDIEPSYLAQITAQSSGNGKGHGFMDSFMSLEKYMNNQYISNAAALKYNQAVNEAQRKYDRDGHMDNQSENISSPIFVLKSVDEVEQFRAEVQNILPSNYLKIAVTSDAYNNIAGPITSLKSMSQITLVVAVCATILILSLMIMLFLRDRKEEFGIYLALGEKRFKIMMQVLIEVLLVVLLSVSIAMFTGNLIANQVSKILIKNQVEKAEEEDDMHYGFREDWELRDYRGEITQDDVVGAYKIKLSLSYVLSMYILMTGTTVVAILLPMGYVLRLKPKKILL